MEQLHTTEANVWPGGFTPDIQTEEQCWPCIRRDSEADATSATEHCNIWHLPEDAKTDVN